MLLHASLSIIDNLGITRWCIPSFFLISDCRYLRSNYRSVVIDQTKDACLSRNFWLHSCTMHCLPATVSVTVEEYYFCTKPRECSFFLLGFE